MDPYKNFPGTHVDYHRIAASTSTANNPIDNPLDHSIHELAGISNRQISSPTCPPNSSVSGDHNAMLLDNSKKRKCTFIVNEFCKIFKTIDDTTCSLPTIDPKAKLRRIWYNSNGPQTDLRTTLLSDRGFQNLFPRGATAIQSLDLFLSKCENNTIYTTTTTLSNHGKIFDIPHDYMTSIYHVIKGIVAYLPYTHIKDPYVVSVLHIVLRNINIATEFKYTHIPVRDLHLDVLREVLKLVQAYGLAKRGISVDDLSCSISIPSLHHEISNHNIKDPIIEVLVSKLSPLLLQDLLCVLLSRQKEASSIGNMQIHGYTAILLYFFMSTMSHTTRFIYPTKTLTIPGERTIFKLDEHKKQHIPGKTWLEILSRVKKICSSIGIPIPALDVPQAHEDHKNARIDSCKESSPLPNCRQQTCALSSGEKKICDTIMSGAPCDIEVPTSLPRPHITPSSFANLLSLKLDRKEMELLAISMRPIEQQIKEMLSHTLKDASVFGLVELPKAIQQPILHLCNVLKQIKTLDRNFLYPDISEEWLHMQTLHHYCKASSDDDDSIFLPVSTIKNLPQLISAINKTIHSGQDDALMQLRHTHLDNSQTMTQPSDFTDLIKVLGKVELMLLYHHLLKMQKATSLQIPSRIWMFAKELIHCIDSYEFSPPCSMPLLEIRLLANSLRLITPPIVLTPLHLESATELVQRTLRYVWGKDEMQIMTNS